MADALTWIGAVGGLVGGGAGLIFGLVSWRQSRSSNKIAHDARELAKSGHRLSTEANELSQESNRIAEAARDLAKEANSFSRRSEARETEVNDVRWVGCWEQPGRYLLTNRGKDEALQVNATVTVDGEEAHVRTESVPGGESISFNFPGAHAQYLREQREIAAYERTVAANRFAHYPIHMASNIFERVVWVTPLGKERLHDIKSPITDLGE